MSFDPRSGRFGPPVELVEDDYAIETTAFGGQNYDLLPDGRLLVVKDVGDPEPAQFELIIVRNVMERVRELFQDASSR